MVHKSFLEGRLVKLSEALQSFNSSSASDLLTELKSINEESTDSEMVETVLNELLDEGPDRKLPLWSKLRVLTRYSQRARLASLRRTLDLTTPPASEGVEDVDNTVVGRKRRRRRALLTLLRTLANPATDGGFPVDENIPAIRQIERRAVNESRRSSSATENLILRRPAELETPVYSVLATRAGGSIEIRKYEPFAVCTVSMNQDRAANSRTDAAVNEPAKGGVKAFGALAGYLFGKNVEQTAMKMTTPVMTTEDRRMSFVLPSNYWKDDAAPPPEPLQGSGVKVEKVDGGERAVLMFGGYATAIDKRKQDLLEGIAEEDTEWEVVPGERPVLAQYNDPFTPPWKRLNEVSVAVQPRRSSSSS